MKKSLLLILVAYTYSLALGQTYRDWPIDNVLNFSVNPALLSNAKSLTIGVTHARKWQNVKSSPTQSNLGVIIPLRNERMSLGSYVFSEQVGPFSTVGISLAYAYNMPVGARGLDNLSLGLSIRLMNVKFDQEHFVFADGGDALLSGIEGNRFVPPSFSMGFEYSTAAAEYANPVQLLVGGSIARFLPFQDRFNTLTFDRAFQWYGMAGIAVYVTEEVNLEPSILLSQVEKNVSNYGIRIKANYKPYGWLMTQYSKAGFLTTQLGFNIGSFLGSGDVFQISASNSWYFGTLSSQLGNKLTFGFTYKSAIEEGGF